jgi:hypothetical protein
VELFETVTAIGYSNIPMGLTHSLTVPELRNVSCFSVSAGGHWAAVASFPIPNPYLFHGHDRRRILIVAIERCS